MFNTVVRRQITICIFALPPFIRTTSDEFALPPWLIKSYQRIKPPTKHLIWLMMDQSFQENRYHSCSILTWCNRRLVRGWVSARLRVRSNHARSLHLVAAVGWRQLPYWKCLTNRLFPRTRFRTNLLGGESNVTARGCMNISASNSRRWRASFSTTGFSVLETLWS